MDFIKNIVDKNGGIPDSMGTDFLNDNLENLMLNMDKELRLALKMVTCLTDTQALDHMGIPNPMKEFPINKKMMLTLATEMLRHATDLAEVIANELEDGFDDDDYEIDYGKITHGERITDKLDTLLDRVKESQALALSVRAKNDKPN